MGTPQPLPPARHTALGAGLQPGEPPQETELEPQPEDRAFSVSNPHRPWRFPAAQRCYPARSAPLPAPLPSQLRGQPLGSADRRLPHAGPSPLSLRGLRPPSLPPTVSPPRTPPRWLSQVPRGRPHPVVPSGLQRDGGRGAGARSSLAVRLCSSRAQRGSLSGARKLCQGGWRHSRDGQGPGGNPGPSRQPRRGGSHAPAGPRLCRRARTRYSDELQQLEDLLKTAVRVFNNWKEKKLEQKREGRTRKCQGKRKGRKERTRDT